MNPKLSLESVPRFVPPFISLASVSLIALSLLSGSLVAADTMKTQFRIVHYNIKELDTLKLKEGVKLPQLAAVQEVVKGLNPDFFSVNEMQFDLPNVPTAEFQTTGQNARRLADLVGMTSPTLDVGFGPANTGMKAKPKNGAYLTNPYDVEASVYGDPINFGVFPGEYSTALISKLPIKSRLITSDILWKSVRPDRDLTQFWDGNGNPFDEKTVELFDKNFSDFVVSVGGKDIHFIVFHTVPAFDFGKPNSPNLERNADQLSFLEWYLTGQTVSQFVAPANIQPLPSGTPFVAMGDWNTDIIRDPGKAGSVIVKRLLEKFQPWEKNFNYSWEQQKFIKEPGRNQFDYVLVGPGLSVAKGETYSPDPEREELGCPAQAPQPSTDPSRVVVSFKEKGKTCYAKVSRGHYLVKTASDHRPLVIDVSVE